jgi:hypothetical protein
MMSIVTHFLGALLIAYFVRRVFARIIEKAGSGSLVVAIASNLASWFTIAGVIGLIKVFDERFNNDAGWIYLVPQMLWLLFDLGYLGKLTPKR